MVTQELAAEQMNEEDRAYRGCPVLRDAAILAVLGPIPLPESVGRQGRTEAADVFWCLLAASWAAGARFPLVLPPRRCGTIDSAADLRWGNQTAGVSPVAASQWGLPDGNVGNYRAHAVFGLFRPGKKSVLIIGRYSTCCTETRRGFRRLLAMVGKLFPTTNPDHTELLHTANFITQQDIGGDDSNYINDVELLNAPNVTLLRRGLGFPILVVTGLVFGKVDKQPSIRQLYPIAELGEESGNTRAPLFMRLLVAADQPRIGGEQMEFRDEVMAQLFDAGDPTPKRRLTFNIEVTNDGHTSGIPAFERRTFHNWKRIGRIVFDDAVISYNGDFVIHFRHPTWREDTNDPSTVTRENERKVSQALR